MTMTHHHKTWNILAQQLLAVCRMSLQNRSASTHCCQQVCRAITVKKKISHLARSFTTLPEHPGELSSSSLESRDLSEHVNAPDDPSIESATAEGAAHVPVMVKEVLSCLDHLHDDQNQVVLDMTFGAGGHALQILRHFPGCRYIAVDRDPVAFGLAKEFAAEHSEGQVIPVLSKFSKLPNTLRQVGVEPGTVDGVLMDLGVSSMQFDSPHRGFALSADGPLDMRMDGLSSEDSLTAADVVNTLEPGDLARILKLYGEEKKAKAIAHTIVEARYAFGHFTRTQQLADVVQSVFESAFRHDKLHRRSHTATKTFQALRIFVNDELNEVNNGMEVARHFLKPNGRCVAISFHSLEDRIVKRHFHGQNLDLKSNISIQNYFRDGNKVHANEEIRDNYMTLPWQPLQRKVWEPSEEEVLRNPRSRSARLRAAFKVDLQHGV